MLIVIEAALTLPVTVEQAKLDWRVEHDDEDDVIEEKLRAAVEMIETQTTLILAPTVLQERYDRWCDPLIISRAPVRDVVEVTYLDEDGVEQTVDPSDYDMDRTTEGAEIVFKSGFSKPTVAGGRRGVVRVTFSAGYEDPGASPIDPDFALPVRARQAVLYLAGHWYAHREAVAVGSIASEVPLGWERIVAQLRVFR